MKNCIIIGGGIIGLCSAYYLAKQGHQVTIIDKSDLSDGCSHGNAGMIVPSHMIPLAQPGMISQGIKWMFDPTSPFYVKPRLSKSLFSWGMQFYKYANQKHVQKSMPALRDLSLLSKELYQDFAQRKNSFFYDEKGLLMLYKTEKVAEEVYHEAQVTEQLGLEVEYISKENLPSVETGVRTDAIGGILYTSDAHLYPNKFIEFLKKELQQENVTFQSKTIVEDFVFSANKITQIQTNEGNFTADEIVLASGSWSPEVAKKLGIKISILPGKGYSFTLENPIQKPAIPSILCEGKVAVTPMGNDLRFGGTMEITHTNDEAINIKRLQGILNTIHDFYPDINISLPKKEEVWYGFRPCTPSGLPIISKSKKYTNLTLATGHAMMGLSLAPATGKIVQELIDEHKNSVDISMFSV